MKIIKDTSKDIEKLLDNSEDCIKKAILLKSDYPNLAQRYYNTSSVYLDLMKGFHDDIVEIIITKDLDVPVI